MGHLIHVDNGNWYKHYDLQKVVGDVQTKDIVPMSVSPVVSTVPSKKTVRRLAKEGVKDYLEAGKRDILDSDKRVAKAPDAYVAKPSNLADLKEKREVKVVKNPRKETVPGDIPFIEFKENKKWTIGKNEGVLANGKYLIRYPDGSEAEFTGDEVLKFKQAKSSRLTFQ